MKSVTQQGRVTEGSKITQLIIPKINPVKMKTADSARGASVPSVTSPLYLWTPFEKVKFDDRVKEEASVTFLAAVESISKTFKNVENTSIDSV